MLSPFPYRGQTFKLVFTKCMYVLFEFTFLTNNDILSHLSRSWQAKICYFFQLYVSRIPVNVSQNKFLHQQGRFFLFISNILGTKFIKVVINTPLYMNCLRMKLLLFMQEWCILEGKKCYWQWLITLYVCTFLRPSLKKDYLPPCTGNTDHHYH